MADYGSSVGDELADRLRGRLGDDLRHTVGTRRRVGGPAETTLKGIDTGACKLQQLWEWAEIADRVVRG